MTFIYLGAFLQKVCYQIIKSEDELIRKIYHIIVEIILSWELGGKYLDSRS